jgi:hypothetical protein
MCGQAGSRLLPSANPESLGPSLCAAAGCGDSGVGTEDVRSGVTALQEWRCAGGGGGQGPGQPHLELAAMRVSPASPRAPQVQSSVFDACLPGTMNTLLLTWHTAVAPQRQNTMVRSDTLRRMRRDWWFDSTGAGVSSPKRFWARRMHALLASRVRSSSRQRWTPWSICLTGCRWCSSPRGAGPVAPYCAIQGAAARSVALSVERVVSREV